MSVNSTGDIIRLCGLGVFLVSEGKDIKKKDEMEPLSA